MRSPRLIMMMIIIIIIMMMMMMMIWIILMRTSMTQTITTMISMKTSTTTTFCGRNDKNKDIKITLHSPVNIWPMVLALNQGTLLFISTAFF